MSEEEGGEGRNESDISMMENVDKKDNKGDYHGKGRE
jgi:hypothetical protein